MVLCSDEAKEKTMIIYIVILLGGTLSSFCYSKSKDLSAQIFFLTSCFLILFVPAALRYGIGADYFSYCHIYNIYKSGREVIDIEPFMVLLIKCLLLFDLPSHSLIVAYAFLTNLFVFLGIPKKYFYIGIPVYILVFYLETWCVLRQIFGVTIIVYVSRLWFEKKYKSAFIFAILAFFNHKSMIIPLFVLFSSSLFPYINTPNVEF